MRSLLSTFFVLLAVSTLTSNSANAAPIEFPTLSLQQGFDFQFGVTAPFAHLISLQIGNTTLAADVVTKNPMTNKNTNIVGAMSSFSWKAGLKDPMKFTFHVSEANRKRLLELQKKSGGTLTATFNYQIFSYDPESKDFFIALKSFTFPHRGILNKIGKDMPSMKTESMTIQGSLQKVSDRPFIITESVNASIKTRANYAVQVNIAPLETKQQILVQHIPPTENKALNWGIIEK